MTKRGKPTKAQLEAQASYEKLVAKWEKAPKFAKTPRPKEIKPLEAPKPLIRNEIQRNSLMTPGGATALKPSLKYTGTEMVGIATMHKSNAVPVFDSKSAIEVSSMRRG